MKVKETLIYLIEKYGLIEMEEADLLQSVENMIKHYITKNN